MKKVVHFTVNHNFLDNRVVNKFAVKTHENGFDCYLIITHPDGCFESNVNGIKHIYIEKKGLFKRLFYSNFKNILKALKIKPDIIHFHDPELLPYFIFLKIFNRKIKIIFDMHENVSAQILSKAYIPSLLRKPIAFFYRCIEKTAERFLDMFVLAEDSYIDLIRNKNKAIIVRNYPIISNHSDNNESDFDFTSNPFKLVYIGSNTVIRGIYEMIKVTAELKNRGHHIQLNIIGHFMPKELENDALKFAETLNLSENECQLLGPMANNDGIEIIKNCHFGLALLHPVKNYLKSLPTKLFEYYLSEKPAVVSNFQLWKDILNITGSGFSEDPFDIEKIASGIEKYIIDRDLCRLEGLSGKKATIEHFSFDKDFVQVKEMYNRL